MTSTLLANTRGIGPTVVDRVGFAFRVIPALKESMPELLAYFIKIYGKRLPEGSDVYPKRFYYDTA